MNRQCLAALVVLAMLAAACGSTVGGAERSTGALSQESAGGEAAFSLDSSESAASGESSAFGEETEGPAGRNSARLPGSPSEVRAGGEPPNAAVTGAGPRDPVQVGFFISKNAEALFEMVGWDDLSPGNTERQVQAMVKYVNAHGGLAGHPIEPVFGVWDATAGDTASQRQAACARWFEDNDAIAVLAESFDVFQGCATKANAPLLAMNVLHQTQRRFEVAPTMITMSVPADDRMIPAWIEGLEGAGYFTPEGVHTEPRIGVMYEDYPDMHHSFNDILVPTLGRHGYEVTEHASWSVTSFASDIRAAILRFRASDVTHVILYDGGALGLLFMGQAESQAYRPRYGLTSYSNPAILEARAPQEQLAGTVGIGWLPTTDVRAEHRPPDNSQTQACVEIMTEAGEGDMSSPNRHTALTYCDLTLLLQGMTVAGGGVTTDAMMGGLHVLGDSYESALTFRADYDAPRRDGAAAYRPFAFDESCSCFRYGSGLRQF